MEYFGLRYIKEKGGGWRVYGALFTCLAIRAIYIEVAHSMKNDSFLQAWQHFFCPRRPIRQFRSDQGTNFVAAENELKAALQEIDDEKIKAELC